MTDPAPGSSSVGRRQIVTYNTTGQPSYAIRELTLHDFLDPQPGDEFFHGDRHDAVVAHLIRCLRHLYRYNPFVAILSGVKLIWDDPALPQPMPDVAIMADLPDPHRYRSTFDVVSEGIRPRCIIEVTSPHLATIDLAEKRDLYARARVPEYFAVQPPALSPTEETTLTVAAFRLEHDTYKPILPDGLGRVYSATNKAWFVTHGDGLQIIEERTGAVVMPPDDAGRESPTATQIEAALRAQSIASQLKLGQ